MKKVLKIMGIITAVLFIVILLGFWYLYSHGMSGMASTSTAKDGQIKVACVGDSTTYGHGTTSWPKNTYPATLQALLGDAYHVNNYGVSSQCVQTTGDRSYRDLPHYQESLEYDADIVVFMMGSNDSKPINWRGADAFRADLESLLDTYSDAEIYLCTLPSAFFLEGQTEGVTNHNIQPLVTDEIAEVTRQVAADRGYTLIDIHALTAQHPEWFAADGVHPSNDGAAGMAQEIYAVLTQQ